MDVTEDYRIAFFTNTYLPFVGGVSRSVDLYQRYLLNRDDTAIVFAPEYDGAGKDNKYVRRLPSIRNFNQSDFSVPLPITFGPLLNFYYETFDLVHVHHPFLLGEMGMRMARQHRLPLVFTYHTQYERYTHYVPFDKEMAGRTIQRHSIEFCNFCDLVIAPTEDIHKLLVDRGVTVPIAVLPTGIEIDNYADAEGEAARVSIGLDEKTPLLLHVGRLAHEKNLEYLVKACKRALSEMPEAHLAIVGEGKNQESLEQLAKQAPEVADRIHFTGKLVGDELVNMYAAADLFVFASKSETQGMVLVESMAAGTPVIALEADGVREVMRDGKNGRMLDPDAPEESYAEAVVEAMGDRDTLAAWSDEARKTAEKFDMRLLADKLHGHYRSLKLLPQHRLNDETISFGLIRNYFETVWEDFSKTFTRI